MTEYLQVLWRNIWKNRSFYALGVLFLIGTFLMKWLSRRELNQEQGLYTEIHHSHLEQNLKDWAFYRYILHFFISPLSHKDLLKTEIGAITELNDILIYLEEWGGLCYSDGVWLITEKGKKILEKYRLEPD
jgi:hypothetical protein